MARRHATATVSELDGNTCMNRCPEFELRVGPLLLLESINRRLHVSLQRTVSYTGQSRIPFQTLKMNPRKHTPRNEQQMQKYWGGGYVHRSRPIFRKYLEDSTVLRRIFSEYF